jgi:competence protein ComFA
MRMILSGDKMIEKISYINHTHSIKAVDKRCNRCLGKDLLVAENQHVYCEECSKQRTMSDHLFLNRYERPRFKNHHQLFLPFELSDQQMAGQSFIQTCYEKNRHGFLHAVCGAGKTEMTLETILHVLKLGQSLAFVIPRVQVIKQVVKRFRSYFKHTNICGLYQGQIMDESADIYIATPQQLIGFYHEFDLIIIDEADAFPFYQNQYLYRLVEKALKAKGIKIYISATLPQDYQIMIESKDLEYYLIPERFHGKDLIIPDFKKYAYLYSDEILNDICAYSTNNKRLLIFFPSIHLMTRYHYFLSKKGLECQMVSSKTRFSHAIIRAFTNQDFTILLTTTILERGVTFPNCDVFVLETDHPVFDRDTLIQIAGRVGRDQVFYQGLLVFYSRFLTKAMKSSKAALIDFNRLKTNDM